MNKRSSETRILLPFSRYPRVKKRVIFTRLLFFYLCHLLGFLARTCFIDQFKLQTQFIEGRSTRFQEKM